MKLRKIKIGKKGILGLDTARDFILMILTISVIAFAAIIAMGVLRNTNAVAGDNTVGNATANTLGNVSAGIVNLFSNAGTWFTLLSVVIIILIIAVVILAVGRFGQRTGGL